MTQALTYNPNKINQDNINFFNDDNSKSSPDDFAKILDIHTKDSTKDNDKSNTSKPVENLSDEADNQTEDCKINDINDLTIIENVYIDEETTISESNEEKTEDNTITEEEPTMQNELITLNDPISLTLLNSQQIVKLQTDTNENDTNSNEIANTNFKENYPAKSTELKQFETLVPKESIANNIIKNNNTNTKTDNQKIHEALDEKVIKDLNIESINQEAAQNENSSYDLMQNQTPQEQAVKVMIQGDIKYEDISLETNKVINFKPTEISPNKIIEQITKQMENMHNNSSKLNIVLNPDKLGKVNLQIMNSKDGLTAQFTVTTQEAKDILMKGLQGLKEALLAHGINSDNISVKLETTDGEYHQDYSEQENSKGAFKHQNPKKQKEKDKKPFEQMMLEIENNDNLI